MLARLTYLRTLVAALAVLLALRMPALAADQDETESDTEEEPGSEEADTGVDPNQPSVYSGGRYTLVNFPEAELFRTLLLVQGVLELRADLGIDMTKGSTFKTWAIALEGHYGLSDTLELQGGFATDIVVPDAADGSSGDRAMGLFAAIEGSIMYDLLDWRVGLAVPLSPGDATVDIFFGLPLKFRILKDRLAILALEQILTIHTHSTEDAMGESSLDKPDLTLSLGVLIQILKPLAVIARGTVISVGFESDEGAIQFPLQIDGQYTISNRMDVGVALILPNLLFKDASASRKPIDQRAIAFFFRFRI